ncbi:bifunctional uridylate/adenylate kinase [Sporobolomyces salmoneus]|uniref:bifunctional uridylate/adenylate kinase n=1 Tax=Sporobolomyces salmoneus TaxID=183962 RepID=UPI00317C3D7B
MATPGAPNLGAPASTSASASSSSATPASSSSSPGPAFDPKQVTVIFVLGGPGAGKGTQCARLVQEHQFVHLSAGDLLRAEQARSGSEYGEMIKTYIKEGKIVPMEVTIKLLENAMRSELEQPATTTEGRKKRFLIDGFPRQMDQAVKFDESVCPSSLVLFLVCPENILQERLLERGKTSGRDDDNAESIKKRFQTFINTSMPVVEYYRKQGKVVDIDSSKTIDQVYEEIVEGIKPVLSV